MCWAVKGKRILIADDSIVEGNQLLARIFGLKERGAEEVHLAIATPPMKYPCPFDVTPRGELLAAKYSVEEMRKILGAKTLKFNTVDDFADSIIGAQSEKTEERLARKNICLGCFTGEFPQYK